MGRSGGRCFRMIKCKGKLRKVQHKYKDKYYLGYRCSKCGGTDYSLSQNPTSSPWKNVPEITNVSSKTMRGLEILCRQS